jgi:hypothetical protein
VVGKTKPQTKDDARRLAVIVQIGCLPCLIDGWGGVEATVQHITEGGRRVEDEHQNTYGSCTWHHLGEVPPSFNGDARAATRRFGPSFYHSKREFAMKYGSERQLVLIQDRLVEEFIRANEQSHFMTSQELSLRASKLFQDIVLGGL